MAIEHTLIETFKGQEDDNFRFMKVFGVLEDELREPIGGVGHISVTVAIGAVQSKLERAGTEVRSFLIKNLQTFPNGTTNYRIGKPAFDA